MRQARRRAGYYHGRSGGITSPKKFPSFLSNYRFEVGALGSADLSTVLLNLPIGVAGMGKPSPAMSDRFVPGFDRYAGEFRHAFDGAPALAKSQRTLSLSARSISTSEEKLRKRT